MSAAELSTFLIAFLCTVVGLASMIFARSRSRENLLFAILSAALLSGTILFFILQPNPVFLPDRIVSNFRLRPLPTTLAAVCGVASAVPWCVVFVVFAGESRGRLGILKAALIGGLCVSVAAFGMFLFDELSDVKVIVARCYLPGFEIEEIATLEVDPIRVATDGEGKVFISYYTIDADGHYDGGIYQVTIDPSSDKPSRPQLVASSSVLFRPFGLAVRNGDIYVARSGIHTAAVNGQQIHPNLGAVTRLSDIDNDGLFEFFDDVITDIPGARGPDAQHQNNGIAFDNSGNLFMAIGTNDDRTLDDHPWGGTILKASPDLKNVKVFAKGFRNPFGLTVGPNGSLFVTDNDVRSNAGDEVNHVRQGLHYGHPWVVGQPGNSVGDRRGFENPIYLESPNGNLCGVAYAGSNAFPESCRGCLFAVNRPDDAVLMMRLKLEGERMAVSETIQFAKVLTPVDICCSDRGEIFVLSRVYRKLYRMRAK